MGFPATAPARLSSAAVARFPGSSYLDREPDRRTAMTQFDDRERAFESIYARDQEMQFKIVARRNRLLGQWAAKKMGLTEAEAEAYAKDVIRSDFEEAGDHDVVRKLLGDLTSAGIDIEEDAIRQALEHKTVEARRHFIEAQG
jgi:hypothetical protein